MTSSRRFLVCIHDATPAYARETGVMIRDLAPLIGRRLSFGVVPNWYGAWPLAADPGYCRLVRENSEELLLHGYFHRRQPSLIARDPRRYGSLRRRAGGPAALLTKYSDEMNGLDPEETHHVLDRGQRVFSEVFGEPARGFIAPAWQPGHVRPGSAQASGLDHVLGFFSLESYAGARIPLATWAWDCGRWSWLGHVGHAVGSLLQSLDRVPVLAIHPRDLDRGFWPRILRVIRELLETGHEPSTPAQLLENVARPGSQGRGRALGLRRTQATPSLPRGEAQRALRKAGK